MKALTVTQPWAMLIAVGVKRVETRTWTTTYRGPLLIHAAKTWTADDRAFAAELYERLILPVPPAALPLGAFVARCRLQFVGSTGIAFATLTGIERELGDFSRGRFGWTLTQVEALPEPIPWRGALGLWEAPYAPVAEPVS